MLSSGLGLMWLVKLRRITTPHLSLLHPRLNLVRSRLRYLLVQSGKERSYQNDGRLTLDNGCLSINTLRKRTARPLSSLKCEHLPLNTPFTVLGPYQDDHFLTARKYTILGVPITDVHVRAHHPGSSMSEHFGLRSAEPKVRCILALLLRSDHDIRQNVLIFPISRR